MILLFVFALSTATLTVAPTEQSNTAADVPKATSPATPAAQPAIAPGSSPLSSLVAEAIKRKLERVNANKGAAIEVPAKNNSPVGPVPLAPSTETRIEFPMIAPAPTTADPIIGPAASPEANMLTSGARLIMGAPTDGSPAYVRVAPDAANAAAKTDKQAAPIANPMARSNDPMEAGADSAAAASEPGPGHNLLDVFVGSWDVTANFDTGPGQPPETASGTMVNSWALGGRWLRQEYDGKMTSLGAFRGLGFIGYDNIQKTYVATWMDTLSTSCMNSKGSYDESTSTFTLTGDFSVPGGERYKQKQVMTVLSPDRYVVTMFLTGPDGVEFKTGNLEYTRSVKRVTAVSTNNTGAAQVR